jgi:Fur family ferric uptake transcriptional regulator
MSERALQILREHVQSVGLKTTRQRDLIATEFFARPGHVTAEEIHKRVRGLDSKISLATVYRTLKLLQACGLARAHQFGDGHARFEPSVDDAEHHDHLICTQCGQITEFLDENIERLQTEVAAKHGFVVEHHRMELYGLCSKCQPSHPH